MSGRAEKKDVSLWQDRRSSSGKWRDSIMETEGWERFIKEYKGEYDVVLGSMNVPPINEVFSFCESTKANLFFNNPYIAVNPRKEGSIMGAVILEAAVNHYWKNLNQKREVELEIIDALLVGHAWHKVGTHVELSGQEGALKIEEESLYGNRVSWRDMYLNIGTKHIPEDSQWLMQRILVPTYSLKKRYGARAADLKGAIYPSVDEKHKKGIIYKDDISFSFIFEIWDAKERKKYLMADEMTDQWLDDPQPWPDWVERFTDVYQFLGFNDMPDDPYPMSDVKPWEPQVLEKIKVFTMALNHIKRWNRQMLVKKNTMDDSEMDKFEKGIDSSILEVKGDPQTMTKPIDWGSVSQDAYIILDRLDQIIRTTNGNPEFNSGGSTATKTRTLGELDKIEGGSQSRTNRKLDRIEGHCANIAKAFLANIKANFDVEAMVKITGNEPQEILKAFEAIGKYYPTTRTITFTKEDIRGEYDVDVKAGSTLPLDKQTRDQILDQVLQTAVQLARAGPTIPAFAQEIIKERVRDYGLKGLEQAFKAQNDQAAQAAEQQAQEHQVGLDKTQAEADKRKAQANEINTKTQLSTLQTIGKATGLIHHEADLVGK